MEKDCFSSSHAAAPRGEFASNNAWHNVLAAFVGLAFGLTALPFYTLGVMAKPLTAEFGWSRTVIQGGIGFVTIGIVCSAWAVGLLIDRFGVRRIALISQMGLALGFIGLASQNGNPQVWRFSWFALAILGVGTTPVTWSRGLAAWFFKKRGLALGISLSGTGFTALVGPPIMTMIVAAWGWRAGYYCASFGIMVIALPTVWLFFREKPGSHTSGTGNIETNTASSVQGLNLKEALLGFRFWVLIFSFAAIAFGVSGLIPNLVPMLTDGGLTPIDAARYASLLGLNVIIGRLLSGYLLDILWAPIVAVALVIPTAFACLLLSWHQWPAAAVAFIGLAGGAEFDLMAFLSLRYFGLRNFGKIYGWQWASFSIMAGIGPVAFGLCFDRTGNYNIALYAAAILLCVGPAMLLCLGRYPELIDRV